MQKEYQSMILPPNESIFVLNSFSKGTGEEIVNYHAKHIGRKSLQ